ncbi:hypothetical protein BUALT_Bualt12G0115300 [Buddleja alternifolia]|uniref:CG-1 domain-containing protein n=1 Tax=Buddleja alternifolia TaxID=168488 RepID=A0AAV6WXP9_9LAMI|nr:hypothetical protein BUALT_Bualt12G0115300 [Buddleja alternifolia]
MMENNSVPSHLVGSEIHGFHTMGDLDVGNMMEEAKGRWLRPNEIHAILCNHKYFTVNVKPMNLPKSGTIVLFDRKMLRNFRKDGHNWKKKKDGKTVKEAHEHLKVGNEERIHVYYAHGEDKPTFVRRCYWLLDKSLEHIVLVHYRETKEGSPATPGNSNSSSAICDPSAPWPLSEESDSAVDRTYYSGGRPILERRDSRTLKHHEQRLHEINTLDWDELLVPDDSHKLIAQQEGRTAGFEQNNQEYLMNSYQIIDDAQSTNKPSPESSANSFSEHVAGNNAIGYNISNNVSYQTAECETIVNSGTLVSEMGPLGGGNYLDIIGKDNFQAQDSFGRWMSYIIDDSPGPVVGQALEPSNGHQSFTSPTMDNHHSSAPSQMFHITDVSPAWAPSTEETRILVVGVFNEGQLPEANSSLLLACGDSVVPAEVVQAGVFRCVISPQSPGVVNLYLSFDGHKPISQVLTFEFRAPIVPNRSLSLDDKSNWAEVQLKMRLAHLLVSSSNILSVFSTKLSQSALKEAKAFAKSTSHVSNGWVYLTKLIEDAKMSFPQAKDTLFELTLQNRLQEWLLEKVISGSKISERDEQGQGVIHLCAILGYTWAVYPFSCSGLSMDFRDKYGWTALHWAAYYGREKMVATLLSAGAKPNLVTDPTSENPGGCTAADLASKNGFDGLAAYLAEKGLVAQFNDMTLAGNVSGSLQTTSNETVTTGNFTEDELYLKDTLAAYRTAADAAARIQTAFREHSLKVRTKVVESSNPEMEARNIVAAMKIQHAFRNYETRKKMVAAVRIQYRFRTWKMRRDFLNMRRHAVKIQAVFRGFQVRRQYCKIVWSVGVLEKAVLRWRRKRKGFHGLQIQPDATPKDPNQENDAEEDFFKASRKQAEERVERSVVSVQAMFRSKQAQEDYRRMKLEHNKATVILMINWNTKDFSILILTWDKKVINSLCPWNISLCC